MKLFSAVYRSRLAMVLRSSNKNAGRARRRRQSTRTVKRCRDARGFLLGPPGGSWTFSVHLRSLCMKPIYVHFSVASARLLKPCCLAAVRCAMTTAKTHSAPRAACSFFRTCQRVARFVQGESRIRTPGCAETVCGHHRRSTPPSSLAITLHLRMCWYKT